ncbi:hypothetical protein Gpo141_00011001 [Globisporangium polare]
MPLDAMLLLEVDLLVADVAVQGDAETMADDLESEAHACVHSHTDSTTDTDSEAPAASAMRRAAGGRKRVSSSASPATPTEATPTAGDDGEHRKRKAHKKST